MLFEILSVISLPNITFVLISHVKEKRFTTAVLKRNSADVRRKKITAFAE
jgi:hypothetical protein